jgi:hypothetical protein
MKMTKFALLSAITSGISVIAGGGFYLFNGMQSDHQTYYSQSGRDAAVIELIRSAKKSILVRTSALECVPIANELGQESQKKIAVHIEMPLNGSRTSEQLINILVCQCGATMELSSLPNSAYEGTYVLVDGREMLYSASPLTYAAPGEPRSFVRGTKHE